MKLFFATIALIFAAFAQPPEYWKNSPTTVTKIRKHFVLIPHGPTQTISATCIPQGDGNDRCHVVSVPDMAAGTIIVYTAADRVPRSVTIVVKGDGANFHGLHPLSITVNGKEVYAAK